MPVDEVAMNKNQLFFAFFLGVRQKVSGSVEPKIQYCLAHTGQAK